MQWCSRGYPGRQAQRDEGGSWSGCLESRAASRLVADVQTIRRATMEEDAGATQSTVELAAHSTRVGKDDRRGFGRREGVCRVRCL